MEVGRARTDFRALANQVLLLSVATRMRGKRTGTLEDGQTGNPETSIKNFQLTTRKTQKSGNLIYTKATVYLLFPELFVLPKFLATTSTKYVGRSFSNYKSNSEPIN